MAADSVPGSSPALEGLHNRGHIAVARVELVRPHLVHWSRGRGCGTRRRVEGRGGPRAGGRVDGGGVPQQPRLLRRVGMLSLVYLRSRHIP